MKFNLFLILLILVFYSNASAQISLGINYEPFILNGSAASEGISIFGITANIGYKIDSTKSILFRTGFYSKNNIGRQIAGSNFTLLGKYQFDNSLYCLTGCSLYKNDAVPGMGCTITNRLVFLLNIGVGTNLSDWLHFENILLIPVGNNEFSTIHFLGGGDLIHKVSFIYKIILSIEFEL